MQCPSLPGMHLFLKLGWGIYTMSMSTVLVAPGSVDLLATECKLLVIVKAQDIKTLTTMSTSSTVHGVSWLS